MTEGSIKKIADAHFLIVDDQAFIRSLLQGMLRGLGAKHMRTVANGEEALEALLQNRIHCVISDWNMAPVNGLELLRKIRMRTIDDVSATLPFILFSGYGTSSVVTKALNLDVSACLIKPASAAKLREAIKGALAKQWTAKPQAHYAAVEVGTAPNELERAEKAAAQWAEWVKRGKPEYFSTQTVYLDRKVRDIPDDLEPAPPEVRNIRHKYLDAIKPGSVLVEEVCDADGVTLLVAGTVISEKILLRLRTLEEKAGEKRRVWVGRLEQKP